MSCYRFMILVLLVACHRDHRSTMPTVVPTPSVQVGECGVPGRDGIVGKEPRLERADRDLDGDGIAESIVVDRSLCTREGNCYWNVFLAPPAGSQECARYAGSFAGAALEPIEGKGDNKMTNIRGYWNLQGGRLLLQSYRFARGGYLLVDALLCKRAGDDKLDCIATDSPGPEAR